MALRLSTTFRRPYPIVIASNQPSSNGKSRASPWTHLGCNKWLRSPYYIITNDTKIQLDHKIPLHYDYYFSFISENLERKNEWLNMDRAYFSVKSTSRMLSNLMLANCKSYPCSLDILVAVLWKRPWWGNH